MNKPHLASLRTVLSFAAVVGLAACGGGGGASSSGALLADSATSPKPLPTLSFSASPAAVNQGENSTLSWSSSNATSCMASDDWSGIKGISGSFDTGPLNANASYSLSCNGEGGGVVARVTVQVDSDLPNIGFSASSTSVVGSEDVTLSWAVTNADSCEASGDWSGSKALSGSENIGQVTSSSSFTLSCTGAGGTASSTLDVSVISTTSVQLTAAPAGVPLNGSTTLTWTSQNATSCSASGGWSGNKALNGSEATAPISSDTSYQLSCNGPNGTALALTTVTVRIASLAWDIPTQNTDGTALTDLSGYKLYWGTQSRQYSDFQQIDDPATTDAVLNLPPATYYFAITAVNDAGIESAYSNELSKAIL